jgi:hypothetical protein
MPLGMFKGFGNPGNPMGQNPLGPNLMGNGMGFPRQNLLRNILSSPTVRNQIPNLMGGLRRFMPLPFGQTQSQLFGPMGNPQNQGNIPPMGGGIFQNPGMNFPGNLPPGAMGNIPSQQVFPQQAAPQQAAVKPTPAPSPSGGFLSNLLGRLGLGK